MAASRGRRSLGFNLESSTVYYWLVAGIAFLVLILLWRFHHSTVGSVLVAIRENEQRARFLGYPTNRYKLAAFVLSASLTGLAGILLLFQNRMTSADPISVAFSGDLLAMVVIGGMRNFLGPALGALFFILFREFLGIYTENWLFWFGLVFVGFIVFSPTGLVGVGERLMAPFRKKVVEDAAMSARIIEVLPLPEFLRPKSRVDGAVLSARHIVKSFGGIKAVQGIDIAIADRTLHALIGPNGAGKTTAFNLLSGLYPPDEGTVSLLGQPISGRTPESIARAGIGRSFQITNLFPALSVGENIRLAVQARHPRRFDPFTPARSIEAINAETDAIIRYLGLAGIETAEAGMLSYGGQRLLDMGVALATAPRVLLLDEPLAGLAAAERERIGAIIKRISSDLPVLLVEHDIDRVFQLADQVTVMNEGRVLLDGSVEDARASAKVQEVYIGSGATEVAARPRETAARAGALLTATHVDTFYGKSHILNDVSFTLHANEIIALLGRNGAGKSTLLKTLIGIAPASQRIDQARRQRVGRQFIRAERPPRHRLCAAGPRPVRGHERGTKSRTRRLETPDRQRRALDQGAHLRILPAHPRAARQPGGLPLRRRAADGRGRPRAVGRRAGIAAGRTFRGPCAGGGRAIVRDFRPPAQGNRHHHRRSPSRPGAGLVRCHGGAGARPGDSSGAVQDIA